MKVLIYNHLNVDHIHGYLKVKQALEAGNFAQADVRKLSDNLYRAKLNKKGRLLFTFLSHNEQHYCLILEYLPNHEYEKSRFLERGVEIDENKIPVVDSIENIQASDSVYLNRKNSTFNILDKIISFDDDQSAIYKLPAPLVVIGSAGSGKTALILEKMKDFIGDILFVSLSPFLVQNARNLYFANGYHNDEQNVDFLSYHEFIESIQVPQCKEITIKSFQSWFNRSKGNSKITNYYKLFEEFRGVLTGTSIQSPWLSRDEYLNLGVKQSVYTEEERIVVYSLFEKYLNFLQKETMYDINMLCHAYLSQVRETYDFVFIDEVQDLTTIQLFLTLKTLRTDGQFILSGDSNQIVHPNFFSWSKIKSLFFKEQTLTGNNELIRVLQSNYRNAPIVTEVANRILKIKHARFGSIDKESNYLVKSVGSHEGQLKLLKSTSTILQDLNNKTANSTEFAVLVMHSEQKHAASKYFKTPLIFSIQEAKGLEYTNIILFNFIAGESSHFKNIASGVNINDLSKENLKYARSKNKNDKALEVYKFYVNALYVAVTRSVNNLYIVEENHKHPIVHLLDLEKFSGELNLQQQKSSLDAWQKEARKLELQGKEEQAQAIRNNILQQQPVPWPVLDSNAFNKLTQELKQEKNKKKQILALEYALVYYHRPLLNELYRSGVKAVSQPEQKSLKVLYRKHFINYDLSSPNPILREVERYGIDHRTIFNLTPLMVATRLGNIPLVKILIERGSNTHVFGNNGFNAFHMALEVALYDEKYAKNKLPLIYELLQPESLSIQVEGRLIKLDKQLMCLFLYNVMFAMFYRFLGDAITHRSAFTAKQLTETVQQLSDSVLPERRKKQAYISSILSGNEVDRKSPYNRQLFKRIKRGHYIINPELKIKINTQWQKIYDHLQLSYLGFTPVVLKSQPNEAKYSIHFNRNDYAEEIDAYSQNAIIEFRKNLKRTTRNTVNEVLEDAD